MRGIFVAPTLLILATALVAQDPVPVGNEFDISTTLGYDGVWSRVAAGAGGEFVVVWDEGYTKVRGQRFTAEATPVGDNFVVNTTLQARQTHASIDIAPSGNFVVSWQGGNFLFDGQDGALGAAMLRRFSSDGSPQGDELVVNSYTTGDQKDVAVSVGGSGEFVVVWASTDSAGPDTDSSIQGQRFLFDGNLAGGEFQINAYTTGDQGFPAIDHAPNGDFVVVWQSSGGSPGNDNNGISVIGRRFAANGNPIGSDLQINTFTFGNQVGPEVAVGPAGEFMVVWANAASSVQGQRFNSDGSPQGGQFQVETYTSSLLFQYPTIAASQDGEFLVTWSSGHFTEPGPDGSRRAVAAQLYASGYSGSPDGGRLGSEIVVNTSTALSQWRSAVTTGPSGVFTVVWQDESHSDNRGQQLVSPTLIFADGFESGDVSSWSASVP